MGRGRRNQEVAGEKVGIVTRVEYVIDASIAVKWFSKTVEEDLDKALELQRMHMTSECSLVAPDLLIYEVTNALRYNRNLTGEDIKLALASLVYLQMGLVGVESGYLSTAVGLAYDKGLTIYDASYIALALERNSIFVSADGKMLDKLDDLPNAVHLKDLRL